MGARVVTTRGRARGRALEYNQKGTHKQFTMQAVVVAIAKIMHVCTRQL
jgi:hypothetical protein